MLTLTVRILLLLSGLLAAALLLLAGFWPGFWFCWPGFWLGLDIGISVVERNEW